MIAKHTLSLAMGTVLCSAGLLGLASAPDAGASSETASILPLPQGGGAQDFLFGLRVAGVYVNAVNAPPNPVFQSYTTFHADGTYNSSEENDLADGTADGMIHGIWKRTGFRQATLRQLIMSFDATGAPELVFRSDLVVQWAPGLQSVTFAGTTDVFLPTQDPLDPSAVPIQSVPFTGSSERMRIP